MKRSNTARQWPFLWGVAGLLLAGGLQAAPAPWYWWVSKLDGQRVCAQHMPAQGWEQVPGAYAQAGCQAPR